MLDGFIVWLCRCWCSVMMMWYSFCFIWWGLIVWDGVGGVVFGDGFVVELVEEIGNLFRVKIMLNR